MTAAVVMSVYANDDPDHFRTALDSILCQATSLQAVHIGVDGPVPAGLETLLSEQAVRSALIRLHWYPVNRGLAHVLNDLIDEAIKAPDCEYVFRMDADDICLPDRFSRQLDFMRAHPTIDVAGAWAWIFGDQQEVGADMRKSPQDEKLKLRLPIDSPFVHPTVVFRASVLRAGHRYPTDTVRFEDLALWAQLAMAGCVFGNLQDHVLRYRFTQATAARRVGFNKTASEFLVRSRYCLRRMPWRLDIMGMVLAVTLSKLLLPAFMRGHLFALRTRFLKH